MVLRWKEVAVELEFPMELNIGNRHRTAGEEGGQLGEQSESDKDSGDQFNHATDPELREHFWLTAGHDAEYLLSPVKGEEKANDDA